MAAWPGRKQCDAIQLGGCASHNLTKCLKLANLRRTPLRDFLARPPNAAKNRGLAAEAFGERMRLHCAPHRSEGPLLFGRVLSFSKFVPTMEVSLGRAGGACETRHQLAILA